MEISILQLFVFITALWVVLRVIIALINKSFSVKRELLLILVYICIVVISRFVYFPFHSEAGKTPTLTIGLSDYTVSLKPFFFLVDRYDGWLMNIIGNIVMFIPVGIVWPICFKKLDSTAKTILAGAGYTFIIEVTQLFCVGRHTDIDDLILNTTGVVIGAIIVFAVRKFRAKKK